MMKMLKKQFNFAGCADVYNRIRDCAGKHSNLIYWIVVSLVLFCYFLLNFNAAMQKGGRWDLNQHLAMADRFLQGNGFYYSAAEASTPYFPGVGFLSVFVGWIFGGARDTVMLILASLIGTAFMYVLVYIATTFTGHRWFSLFLVSIVLFSGFDTYKFYMNEFKADSLVLIYAFLLILLIVKIEGDSETIQKRHVVFMFLISFLMDITKQQALYVDFALGLYIVFSRRLNVRKKLISFASMVSGGIASLIVMLPISGFWLLTIDNLNKMPWWDSYHILDDLSDVFSEYKIGYFAVIMLLFLVAIKVVKLHSEHIMWLLVSLLFMIGQFAGGMKIGGNSGNYQVGIVSFTPFFVIFAFEVVRFFVKDSRQMFITGGLFVIMVLRIQDAFGKNPIGDFGLRQATVSQSAEYLSKHYAGKCCMYDSDHYMMISESECVAGMDIYTVPYYTDEHAKDLENALIQKTYPVLVVNQWDLKEMDRVAITCFNRDSNIYKVLMENYEIENGEDIPPELRNRIYVAK